MPEIRVLGAEALDALARRLKEAGRDDLMKELRKGVRDAVQPLGDAIRAEVPAHMPSGYAPVLARSLQFRISQRGGFTVTMTTFASGRSKRRHVVALNRGLLRHPLWGNRHRWYAQSVRPGFWSEPVDKGKDQVVREAVEAMHRVARKVAG